MDFESSKNSENLESREALMPKILIVDDKQENLFALKVALKDVPADLHTAASGKDALSILDQNKFSLILLDVQMPDMDGFETARIIKSKSLTKDVPIIFVTAFSKDDAQVKQGYEIGAVDYIFKPVDPEVLHNKVMTFVNLYHKTQLNEDINKDLLTDFPALSRRPDAVHQVARPKVLVVDDVPENLLAAEMVLKSLPVDIYKANSGNEALSLTLRHDFCVVLMDVQMPIMDGFETAKLMLEHENTKHIPVIFVTAISKDEKHVFEGYKTGAVDYLLKPINPDILKSKVKVFAKLYEQKVILENLLNENESLLDQIQQSNKQLDKLAHSDALTGLPNRLSFEETISDSVLNAKMKKSVLALLFIDLDNFKGINDTLGHQIGDLLLQNVAERLVKTVSEESYVARLGGDEFAVILEEITDIDEVRQTANQIIHALRGIYKLDENDVHISCSIGVACYPKAGKEENVLIKNADIAMYRAKFMGRNNCQFFTEELDAEHSRRLGIESALRFALNNKEFFLVYQPIIDLHSKKIVSMEVLLRWNNKEFGLMLPEDFIYLAEESGLIIPIGEWVMRAACEQYLTWCKAGFKNLKFSINLSASQFEHEELTFDISSILEDYNVPSGCIEIELTETAVMQDVAASEAALKRLHDMGMNISIDDFGTGYSSLSRLKKLPVSALKIDVDFVRDIGTDESDQVIIKSILALCNSLGLKSIAEGVENEEQAKFLLKHDCQQAQGNYFCVPLKSDEMTNYLKKLEENEK